MYVYLMYAVGGAISFAVTLAGTTGPHWMVLFSFLFLH